MPIVYWSYLGQVDYQAAWNWQNALAQRLLASEGETQIAGWLLLLEHPPTITTGRRDSQTHIHGDTARLAAAGIERIRSNRGGLATYHGPGQLVGYPVVHLDRLGVGGVEAFVGKLQRLMIAVVSDAGQTATIEEGLPGVWIGTDKIGAIGLHVSHRVTTHGFALNIHPDLTHFDWITPCGLADRGVTSLARLGIDWTVEQAAESAAQRFGEVFTAEMKKQRPPEPETA